MTQQTQKALLKLLGGEIMKTLNVRVDEEFLKELKIKAISLGKTLGDFVCELLEKGLQKEKE